MRTVHAIISCAITLLFTLWVCLGVVPKNENKIDEMMSILRELQQQYVPLHSSGKPIGIALNWIEGTS